jgi:uncharacterized protein involved in exopolysaccharide biosynthesis
VKYAEQEGGAALATRVIERPAFTVEAVDRHWATRALILWNHRRLLLRVIVISTAVSIGFAFFVIPKCYTAVTSIMPPDSQNMGTMLLSALSGRGGLGALGGLASSLFRDHSTTSLFVSLLQSGTVSDHLINRFDLKKVYRKRYTVDAAKRLAHATKITDDKKSGVITIKVSDTDPVRARDLAQAYLEELNRLVTQTSTSAARQERVFIEQRLRSVQSDLENAQLELSDFSSRNTAVDMTAQTRAMVDVGARIEGELVAERSGLESMRQVYSDENVRIREAQARIGSLQHELSKLAGSSSPPNATASTGQSDSQQSSGELYPPLRQLPRLAVRYADLYRRVKVQETVFELLTQQYEMARIEEAKDTPVVRVIDTPGIPEKKSFPPRLLLTGIATLLAFAFASAFILFRENWVKVDVNDPRRRLADAVAARFRGQRAIAALVAKGAA